jgi:hypothetical protein
VTIICSCREVIAKSESGVMKIRSKVILVTDGGVAAVCKGCGKEVPMPLQKSAPEPTLTIDVGPPLILSK